MTTVYLVYRQDSDAWFQNERVDGVFDSSEKAHAYIKEDAKWRHIDPKLYRVVQWKVN